MKKKNIYKNIHQQQTVSVKGSPSLCLNVDRQSILMSAFIQFALKTKYAYIDITTILLIKKKKKRKKKVKYLADDCLAR